MPVKIRVSLKALNLIIVSLLLFTVNTATIALEAVLTNGDSLDLFGIGLHQEKRNDIYLGAIFADPAIKQVNELLDSNTNKRMSFKFVSKYSNRKMARMLKQRIAMNNPKSKWRPHTAEIVQFANLFQRSMQAGDEINVDYIANEGTFVNLNETLFLTIKKPEFYELLLNIWFGAIPPSESFKTGIRGRNTTTTSEALIAQYDNLQTIVGRFDADKDLTDKASNKKTSGKKAPSKKVASTAKKTKKTASSSKKASTRKKQASKKTAAKKSEEKISPPKESKVIAKAIKKPVDNTKQPVGEINLSASKITIATPDIKLDSLLVAPILEAPALTKETPEIVDTRQISSEFQGDNTLTADPSLSPTEAAQSESESESESGLATAQTKDEFLTKSDPVNTELSPDDKIAQLVRPEEVDLDLLSGSYSQELFSVIRSKQIYPVRALRKEIEGNLTVQVTVNRDGEIIGQTIIKPSGSRILDRGVLKMLRRAGPFPKIPEELNLQEFEIELPLVFQLTK